MNLKHDISKLLNRWLPPLIGIALWLWFCGPMMVGQTVVGFRDSAYLYYPLFEWIDAQWAAGEMPLWNPYCNFGMPVVGDSTPSLLYPGKLVFFCRFLPFSARYGIYLSLHLLLAGVATYWLARVLRANIAGATLAAVSYAAGGGVIFQVTNVIYLVSAAWLPVALGCVWLMIKHGNLKWAIGAGICCALMILGGDPQMVYHVGLIAAATGFSHFLNQFKRHRRNRDGGIINSGLSNPYRLAVGNVSRLVTMVIVAILLSLPQLVASYQWSQLSERTKADHLINVYQAIGKTEFNTASLREVTQALLGPPEVGTIAHHVYQFSLPPWSLAELFWSNSSGKLYPIHQRWTDALPGADRIWFASLYLGLLPVWLAIGGFRLIGRGTHSWLTRMGLWFGLASFGWYGLVWLINEVLPPNLQIAQLGQQVGGVYWLMVIGLPKYFSFRYPAKLFIITSLCLCVLAGIELRSWRLKFSRTWVYFFSAISIVGLGILAIGGQQSFFERVPADAAFGPFDASGTTHTLIFSFLQAGLVLAAALFVKRVMAHSTERRVCIWLIVMITAIDLAIANRWLLSEIPASTMNSKQTKITHHSLDSTTSVGPVTIYRARDSAFLPIDWIKRNSENRLSEIIACQRQTLYPKLHLGRGVRLLGSFSSIWPAQYESLLKSIEADARAVSTVEQDSVENNALNLKEWLCDAELGERDFRAKQAVDLHWFGNRSRIVFLTDMNFETSSQTSATNSLSPRLIAQIRTPDSPSVRCELVQFGNNSLDLNVSVDKCLWLIHNSIFDGNWKARVKNHATGNIATVPLIEVASCLQGIPIEAGDYQITLFYAPHWFWKCLWISSGAWLLSVVGGFVVGIEKAKSFIGAGNP